MHRNARQCFAVEGFRAMEGVPPPEGVRAGAPPPDGVRAIPPEPDGVRAIGGFPEEGPRERTWGGWGGGGESSGE